MEDDMNEGYQDMIVSIYDSNHVGIVTIQNVLDDKSLKQIRNTFEANIEQFYPLKFGDVTRWDLVEENFHNYTVLELGRKNFRRMIGKVSSIVGMNSVFQEKFSVMFYPKGSPGVKLHRDSEHSVNCVVIFIITGNSSFYTANDIACRNVTELPVQPGDAIVMRAPRGVEDTLSRPLHYVGKITIPRYVMICRHINLERLRS